MRSWLRYSVVWLAGIAAFPAARGSIDYRGINLSAAAFGHYSDTDASLNHLPGTYDVDYTYPSTSDVDYFHGLGMNTFRIPFRWERIQPTPGGALDAIELGRLDAVVSHITSLGASVILDVHNYARFSTPASIDILGTNALPDSQLADLWTRLATQYANRAGVIFGVMNEPFGVSTEEVVGFTNLSLTAIRNTGANNLALVMGNGYSGAHSWGQNWYGTPNATAMLNIVDPGQNLAFEVHQYVDNPDGFALDYSGLTDGVESATIVPEKLSGFTDWLRLNNRRGFLGELGTPSSDLGVQAMYNGVNFVEQNADVWMGWTLWSGGPWWDNPDGNPPTRYHLSLNPLANGDPAPQLAVLAPFLAPVPEPSSVLLLALGIAGTLLLGRRHHLRQGSRQRGSSIRNLSVTTL